MKLALVAVLVLNLFAVSLPATSVPAGYSVARVVGTQGAKVVSATVNGKACRKVSNAFDCPLFNRGGTIRATLNKKGCASIGFYKVGQTYPTAGKRVCTR